MYKVDVGTDGSTAQINFVKQEIKQKSFRRKFEVKKWNEIKLKLIFK